MSDIMHQEAPYPTILAELVEKLVYPPGENHWTFTLEDEERDRVDGKIVGRGLTLDVLITYPDAYHPERARSVMHYFIVPAATYNLRSWRRWLLDQILKIHVHEACEGFTIDGVKPYAPHHGPGNDPYTIFELGTDEEVRTSFKGVVKAP